MIRLSDSHYGNHIVVPSSPGHSQSPCHLRYILQAVGGGLGTRITLWHGGEELRVHQLWYPRPQATPSLLVTCSVYCKQWVGPGHKDNVVAWR